MEPPAFARTAPAAAAPGAAPLRADRDQLARFVHALLRDVSEGGRVAMRAFYDDEPARRRSERAFQSYGVRLNGGGLGPVVDAAVRLADAAAESGRPVVVCPPVATFVGGRAREEDLLEGPVLSVELDERPAAALAVLRAVVGPPTLVVASGGSWTDPGTGEVQDRLHLHWRLKEPTRTPGEHGFLKRARALACGLVGGDATSTTVVHPMRWPGTWHRKDPDDPRPCRIVEENPDAEVALEWVLAELEGLAILREAAEGEGPRASGGGPAADDDLLLACAGLIPNPDLPWPAWNRLGMAFWRAAGGGEAGFEAFDILSRKSPKYDPAATRARWRHYATSPPGRLGAGTLVWEARRADPDFRRRQPGPDPGAMPERTGEGVAPGGGWEAKLEAAIDEMNRRYLVAAMGGRSLIASLAPDDALGRDRLVFSRPQDVRLQYNHRHHVVGFTPNGNPIRKDLGTAWIEDPRRRTFDRIALLPKGPTPPGVFNLWRGFGLERKAGEWSLLRRHLLEIVCSGNEAHLAYLVGWCASCVQHPDRQAEVAVVLRGGKGSGKGTVGQILIRIFRDHALHIVHSRHLTGNFNAHLVDALFLFLDEAFWGGDKQGEGVLKALITERTLMIEPKGVDPFTMPNRLKILIASNADWVVPASGDERRYLVLDVGNERQGDLAYFERLHQGLEDGELAAFLDHLLALDLGGFNVRAVPNTAGLSRQKLIGADSVTRFWEDCLREGAVVGTGSDLWPATITTRLLHAAYLDHARDHGERHPAIDARMAEKLEELNAGCPFERVRLPAGHPDDPRPWGRRLGSLAAHQEAFERALRIPAGSYAWEDDDDG